MNYHTKKSSFECTAIIEFGLEFNWRGESGLCLSNKYSVGLFCFIRGMNTRAAYFLTRNMCKAHKLLLNPIIYLIPFIFFICIYIYFVMFCWLLLLLLLFLYILWRVNRCRTYRVRCRTRFKFCLLFSSQLPWCDAIIIIIINWNVFFTLHTKRSWFLSKLFGKNITMYRVQCIVKQTKIIKIAEYIHIDIVNYSVFGYYENYEQRMSYCALLYCALLYCAVVFESKIENFEITFLLRRDFR